MDNKSITVNFHALRGRALPWMKVHGLFRAYALSQSCMYSQIALLTFVRIAVLLIPACVSYAEPVWQASLPLGSA